MTSIMRKDGKTIIRIQKASAYTSGCAILINIISTNQDILQNHLNVWVPAGICIVIAVLGFNFVGDGLRDALDPKMKR